MNATALCKELHVSNRTLCRWLALGLPHKRTKRGRQYDGTQLQQWLIGQGIVAKPARIVRTLAEAAGLLGIHVRTVAGWLSSGCPGRTPEGIDIDQVEAWRNQRYAENDPLLTGPTSPALERYRLARAQREELLLQRELKEVRSLAEIHNIWNAFAGSFLRACTTIQQNNLAGVDAVQLIREAVDQGERDLEVLLAQGPVSGLLRITASDYERALHEIQNGKGNQATITEPLPAR